MKQQQKAVTYALLAVLCWSTIGSAFKISLRYLDFLQLLLFSSFTAIIVLFAIILVQQKTAILAGSFNAKGLGRSAMMGLLNPFLYYVVLLKAYELLPAQEAGTLNYTWPLVLVLMSIPFLHQRITAWSILAILISFLGIMVISTHGNLLSLHFSSPLGVSLAVGSAVFWAAYWIMNIRDNREEVTRLFLNFCFGFLYTLILVILTEGVVVPTIRGITGSVYLGFFEMGITFVLWLKALKLSSTTAKVSNLIYLSPFISLIFIHFVVGEVVLISTVVGLVLIVGGILLQQYLKS